MSMSRILTQIKLITVTVWRWLLSQAQPAQALQGLPAHCVQACAGLENRLYLLLLLLPPVPKLTQETHTHTLWQGSGVVSTVSGFFGGLM